MLVECLTPAIEDRSVEVLTVLAGRGLLRQDHRGGRGESITDIPGRHGGHRRLHRLGHGDRERGDGDAAPDSYRRLITTGRTHPAPPPMRGGAGGFCLGRSPGKSPRVSI